MAQRRLRSIEDGYDHNYEIGFVHGQRSVISLPQLIVATRSEEFESLIIEDRQNG